MPLAHYFGVGRELHELKHRGEFLPTRNEIMGKIGASILLSYSGLVVSYVTRKELGFICVISSGIAVSSCWYRPTIATLSLSSLSLYKKSTIVSCHLAELVLSSVSDQILLNMLNSFIPFQVHSCSTDNKELATSP